MRAPRAIIVRIDPVVRKEAPRTVREIHDRLVEISFNAAFWLELSALGVILRFVDEGLLDPVRFGRIFFHAIEASVELGSARCRPFAALGLLCHCRPPLFLQYLSPGQAPTGSSFCRSIVDRWPIASAWLANQASAVCLPRSNR